jgi:CO/xanthine dehydrogenase Mo-binding subunit
MRFGIRQPVARTEDARFLMGRGRYVADIDLARQLYAVFVFSLYAHALIRSIDKAVQPFEEPRDILDHRRALVRAGLSTRA